MIGLHLPIDRSKHRYLKSDRTTLNEYDSNDRLLLSEPSKSRPGQALPIVNNGVMFVATPGNQLLALEAKIALDGRSRWSTSTSIPAVSDENLTVKSTGRAVTTYSFCPMARSRFKLRSNLHFLGFPGFDPQGSSGCIRGTKRYGISAGIFRISPASRLRT